MPKARKIRGNRKRKSLLDRSVTLQLDLSNPKVRRALAKASEGMRKFREKLEEGRRKAFGQNFDNRLSM